MLRLIEDREAKAAAQAELEARIRERLADQGVRNIGFPSGNTDEVVYAEGAGGLWAAFTPLKAAAVPRQWNAFGLYDPSLHAQMITVEINVPTADSSARVAGFYARDPQTDRVYLMHDGSVGGGRPGVGRDAFLSWTRATTVDVVRSDGVVRSGVVVGAVEVDDFVPHLRRFVMRVRRFKAAVAAGALDTVEAAEAIAEWEAFNSESSGRRRGRRRADLDYVSYHGDVVDALQRERSSRLRADERILNNRLIDLYVRRGRDMTEIYEVKTGVDRQAIYTGIGQLLTHSAGAPSSVKRTLVVPEGDLPRDIREALLALGIELRRFTIRGGDAPEVVLPASGQT